MNWRSCDINGYQCQSMSSGCYFPSPTPSSPTSPPHSIFSLPLRPRPNTYPPPSINPPTSSMRNVRMLLPRFFSLPSSRCSTKSNSLLFVFTLFVTLASIWIVINPLNERYGICQFCKSSGHNTDECVQLKDAIKYLIQYGKLRKHAIVQPYSRKKGVWSRFPKQMNPPSTLDTIVV